ncbi:MAG: trypsin-like peptidase domain-containing protein [Capsulimonadales bacterium]|nr:trypsin-like peptidase domain-containing protein [Capsulimonadales bacterium]
MDTAGTLTAFSGELAAAVARTGESLVRVDDGSRFTATGILWDTGLVVTTSHGVERDEEIVVITADGVRHAATLVGRDADSDIAVLKTADSLSAPIAKETDEQAVRVGHLALAVARPGDNGLTATLGLITRKYETETEGNPEYILNTDAILYPGFSGGALIGVEGKLLGLLNRLFGQGLGVALGVPLVERIVGLLVAHGKMPRGYLGIRTQVVALPENLRAGLALAQERGLLISGVSPQSPADTAGLLLGDTLLKVNGQPIQDTEELKRYLRVGQTIAVTLLRGGVPTELSATIEAEKE